MTLRFIKLALLLSLLLSSQAYALSVGQKAPDFTLKSFTGKNLRLAEQRGKIILLNFWATWCTPCRQEIPQLNKIHQKYSRLGVSVWGVNIDKSDKVARSMANQLNVSYPILHDGNKSIGDTYSPTAMPYTLLIDRNGKIRKIYLGYVAGYEVKYEKDIRALLKE